MKAHIFPLIAALLIICLGVFIAIQSGRIDNLKSQVTLLQQVNQTQQVAVDAAQAQYNQLESKTISWCGLEQLTLNITSYCDGEGAVVLSKLCQDMIYSPRTCKDMVQNGIELR